MALVDFQVCDVHDYKRPPIVDKTAVSAVNCGSPIPGSITDALNVMTLAENSGDLAGDSFDGDDAESTNEFDGQNDANEV